MAETPKTIDRLGGIPEGRVQRYFCVDDSDCRALERVSKDAKLLRKERREFKVRGQIVHGWIVELEVPATDGVVRADPMAKS